MSARSNRKTNVGLSAQIGDRGLNPLYRRVLDRVPPHARVVAKIPGGCQG